MIVKADNVIYGVLLFMRRVYLSRDTAGTEGQPQFNIHTRHKCVDLSLSFIGRVSHGLYKLFDGIMYLHSLFNNQMGAKQLWKPC